MKKFILANIASILFLLSYSQQKDQVTLSGTVTDIQTGEPLSGAYVTIIESKITASTDREGHYHFSNVPVGHKTVEVSFYGYKTIIEHLDIDASMTKNFQLHPAIIVNEGVTVTAVGGATSIRKAPIPISRISKNDLLITPSSNIVDVLTREPGVSQVSTGPAIAKPVIRGLGFNRLVVINDGIRQEGQQWGEEHGIEIDENSVSRIEVVKGPASLIYGSDALAGVINIITTTPTPINTLKGNILTSYATNNRQRSVFGSLGGNQNGFNWNVWGDYKAASDYKNKYDGYVFNSKFREANAGGYVGYNGRWGYSHFIVSRFNQKVGLIEGARDDFGRFIKDLPGGLTTIATQEDFLSTQPQVPYQHINHLKFISENSFAVGEGRLSVNLGWQQNKRREFGEADQPEEPSLFFDLKTFSYNATYHFDDKNGWTTSAGLSGMVQNNSNRADEVLIPEYNLFDIGGFIYSQKTIGKTTLSGGLRYDKRDLDSRSFYDGGIQKFQDFNKKFYNVSGSAGISYSATENFLLKANLSRGFRAPSIPELASNGAHEGTNRYEYGNQNLRSEVSWQGDAGMELNSDHVLFTASAFYNHINNFIYYKRLKNQSGGDSLVNHQGDLIPAFQFAQQPAHLAGFEIGTDIHPHPLDWFHWQNKFSYVRGLFADEIDGTRNIPLIPAARWVSELRAELLRGGKTLKNLIVRFEMDRNFSQKQVFTAFDTETPTPGYTLFNATMSANVANKGKTIFSVYLMASNVFDVAYQNHLSRLKYADINNSTGRTGVFNMGRNFMVRINIPLLVSTK